MSILLQRSKTPISYNSTSTHRQSVTCSFQFQRMRRMVCQKTTTGRAYQNERHPTDTLPSDMIQRKLTYCTVPAMCEYVECKYYRNGKSSFNCIVFKVVLNIMCFKDCIGRNLQYIARTAQVYVKPNKEICPKQLCASLTD